MVTDVRPKLFDGSWKENVGGADFLQFFDESGAMQYLKGYDSQLHTSGPCLSNASYTSITRDESISSHVEISGARTDDIVRVFMRVRLHVLKNVSFTRAVFFQFGSETYNYHAEFEDFVFGYGDTMTEIIPRTCAGGTSFAASNMCVIFSHSVCTVPVLLCETHLQ